MGYEPISYLSEKVLKSFPIVKEVTMKFAFGSSILHTLGVFAWSYFCSLIGLYELLRNMIGIPLFSMYAIRLTTNIFKGIESVCEKGKTGRVYSIILYKRNFIVFQWAKNFIKFQALLILILAYFCIIVSNAVLLEVREYLPEAILMGIIAFSVSCTIIVVFGLTICGGCAEWCRILVKRRMGKEGSGMRLKTVEAKEQKALRLVVFPVGIWEYEFFKLDKFIVASTLQFIQDQTVAAVFELRAWKTLILKSG